MVSLILILLVAIRFFNRYLLDRSKALITLTDTRSSQVAELVQKIRHIKMAGLESLLQAEIEIARQKECTSIGRIFTLRAAFGSLMDLMPTLGVMIVLGMSYFVSGKL